MTSASSIIWSSSSSLLGFQVHHSLSRPSSPFIFSNPFLCSSDSSPLRGFLSCSPRPLKLCGPVFSTSVDDAGPDPDGDSQANDDKDSSKPESESGASGIDNQLLRDNLERMVGTDDSTFNGMDLATLIRNKYGRSYDVQLIKKEFMGRNLLALNVMWKYREQRSFPLTEEEYILRLNDVANTLKCWGAVSHIRNSLATVKERPRIGKAVSIFIDMDESGGRANEWIYK